MKQKNGVCDVLMVSERDISEKVPPEDMPYARLVQHIFLTEQGNPKKFRIVWAIDRIRTVIDRYVLNLLTTDDERKVITLLFGLDGHGAATLKATGEEIGATAVCVRKIEAAAFRKIRLKGRLDALHSVLADRSVENESSVSKEDANKAFLPILEKRYEDCFKLMRRTHQGLVKEGIVYVGDLVQWPEIELLTLGRVGQKGLTDIRIGLDPHILSLGMRIDWPSVTSDIDMDLISWRTRMNIEDRTR